MQIQRKIVTPIIIAKPIIENTIARIIVSDLDSGFESVTFIVILML